MTVPSNLNSTRFSSIAPARPAEKPASSGSSAGAGGSAQSKGAGTQAQPQPSLPAGLVGHHVNTTA
ncbi:hypothetical protein [Paraburkholderia phenoliruptrix]|uniref:hypothetical protein n=1 Tax=Paraburkholderia phenoliruptrix TaxID=252970 RepID=UPI00286525CC|nr:hypothetical protein [Paraburkholderia phenoliruptrix]MDR6423286.1 hypothetical protein [Paraburkholderia phenoliruptrix]